jgi:hypothetical protein
MGHSSCEFNCGGPGCDALDSWAVVGNQKDYFLLHGFNVKDGGGSTIGRLLSLLPNARVWSYGWLGLLGVRFFNARIANMLAASLTDGCVVIAHSNAAAIVQRALQLDNCPHIERLVLIRPALDSDAVFGDRVDRVDVFHHADDMPVSASRFIPCHEWGDMGAVGYEGAELHVVNHDDSVVFAGFNGAGNHSAFSNETFVPFAKYLVKLLGLDDA